MSSMGWMTESALMPTPSKKIKVEKNSLVDLQVAMIQSKEKNQSGSQNQAKKSKKSQKYEDLIHRKNKNIELRNQKDIEAVKTQKSVINSLNHKSSIYETLQKKGQNIDKLLIDFSQKKIDNMTSEEQQEYERERERFYESKKQEIKEKQEQILQGSSKIELTKSKNQEDIERLEWEKQVMQELEAGLDEDEILNQKEKPKVMQVYDNVASKEQKEMYDEFVQENNQQKSKLEIIKQQKAQQALLRKQKIEALKQKNKKQ